MPSPTQSQMPLLVNRTSYFFNHIIGINEEGVRVNIAAPPKEGEANKELLEYLAEVIGVKKTEISLDKGSKSKSKVVVVEGVDAVSVYDALKEQVEE